MIIQQNAFNNCISLKEIHCEKLDSYINTNIYPGSDKTPTDLIIIVPDIFVKQQNIDMRWNRYKYKFYSQYIDAKLESTPYINVIFSIIYIENVLTQDLTNDFKIKLKNVIKTIKSSITQIDLTKQVSDVKYLLKQKDIYKYEP